MKTFLKNDANTKVRILKPILDDWNDTIEDTWTITKDGDGGRVTIHRTDKQDRHLHGSLAMAIAGICEAYDWVWAIYHDEEMGLHVRI